MKEDKKIIVCFGEVLWDVFPSGRKLGGAPFNVAAHTSQHGNNSYIISSVGNDALGVEIIREIESKGVSNEFVQIDSVYPTGTVDVTIDEKGIPSYEITQPVAWDYISLDLDMIKAVQSSDAFVYGSLASRSENSRKSLITLLNHANFKICDLNIRQHFYDKKLIKDLLFHSDILKINDEEAALLCDLFNMNQENFYKNISTQFNIDIIIQTLGANGAEAWRNDQLFTSPGYKVSVLDTVGSGDAFLSSFIHHYLNGSDIDVCLSNACKIGAYVATQNGAIPIYESEKIQLYEEH